LIRKGKESEFSSRWRRNHYARLHPYSYDTNHPMTASPSPPPLTLRGITFDPPLFCAPMAGITHSAFRRLLSDYGGYGALYTEMLSARMVPGEVPSTSPWLKRRPGDGKVIYQLLVVDTHHLEACLDRLAPLSHDGIDINLACPAATVQAQGGGSNLFDDPARLRAILRVIRPRHPGPLLVKIRLGRPTPDWRAVLRSRLRLFEDEGIDALTLHPRFAEESLNRFAARHALQSELAGETRLPLIANGDITGIEYAREHARLFSTSAGLMIGRMAAARPWVFGLWHHPDLEVDLPEVWTRFCHYLAEDFVEKQALIKLKVFTPFFARNFVFGHSFFTAIQSAPDWSTALNRAHDFLTRSPPRVREISLSGL
jgi:tRNA-dihydrouridine synthase B